MNESYFWSAGAGRWLGIPVRVHLLLLLFLAAVFGIESQLLVQGSVLSGTALVTIGVLMASIVIHEIAHVFALTNLGGHVNSILLMPWGGNSDFAMPGTARSRLLVQLAGPFANGVVFLFGAALLMQSGEYSLIQLINPFEPQGFYGASWESSVLLIVTWVNFQLFAVNLIPCFPFDGAGALRGLIEVLNPLVSRIQTENAVRVFGHAAAIGFIGCAWILREYDAAILGPAWCWSLMFGICLLFSARYAYLHETVHLDDPWDELNEIEHASLYDETPFFDFPGTESEGYSQWLSEKQEARRQEEIRIENEELERSDAILEKLHKKGLDSLSEEEKTLLKRVSDRLRRQRDEQKA